MRDEDYGRRGKGEGGGDLRFGEDGDVARVVGCILVENLHGRKA